MLSEVFKKEERKKELLKEMDGILYEMDLKYECFIQIHDHLDQEYFDNLLSNIKDLREKVRECRDLFRLKR